MCSGSGISAFAETFTSSCGTSISGTDISSDGVSICGEAILSSGTSISGTLILSSGAFSFISSKAFTASLPTSGSSSVNPTPTP